MPTIKGLRRRGYTSETLNGFCNDVGVTRNNNTVDIAVLFNWARSTLDELSPRIMGVVDPLPVTITNFDAISNNGTEPVLTSEIPMYPLNPEKGSHTLELTPEIFIDASDFREDDDASFFGLSVGKTVFIKYMGKITCESVDRDETGAVTRLHCSIKTTARIEAEESKETEKPRGALTWVPTSAVPCELRLYDHLFTVPEPDSNWEAQLNPDSEIVKPHAFLDPSVLAYELTAGEHFQMERWGYFVVDPDTDAASSRIVMNRTVPLRDPQNKTKSRKEEQDAHLAELEARKLIPAEEYFLTMTDLYSAFDDTGVPTHDAAGEPLSKGRIKALRKEWKKQDKLFKKNNA
jgi:glutaminyl-tRNA synthetase